MLSAYQRSQKFRDVFESYNERKIFNVLNPTEFRTRLGPYLTRGFTNSPFTLGELNDMVNVADLLQSWENMSAHATIGAMEDALNASRLDDLLVQFRNIVNNSSTQSIPSYTPFMPRISSSTSTNPSVPRISSPTSASPSVPRISSPTSTTGFKPSMPSINNGKVLIVYFNNGKTYHIRDIKNYQGYLNTLLSLLDTLNKNTYNNLRILNYKLETQRYPDVYNNTITVQQFNNIFGNYISEELSKVNW